MKITTNQSEIIAAIKSAKTENKSAIVGFVPTMGALHEGHVSLIELAKNQCDIVVCSIFVNPTQFNNPDDLATYPRTVEDDKLLLEKNGCDILLLPSIEAVYPNGILPYSIDLHGLDEVMEGAFRPGHFNGVCMVVERLLTMVAPDKAFFGMKDFQQLAIIRKMVAIRKLPVEIIGAPIKRAENGLALSSRNALLTADEREAASLIYKALKGGMTHYQATDDAEAIRSKIESYFIHSNMEIEYIAFVDNDTLAEVKRVNSNTTVCIVVYFGNVRLIDNMQFSAH